MKTLVLVGIPSSDRVFDSTCGLTLSKAPTISRKTQVVARLEKNPPCILLVRIVRLS